MIKSNIKSISIVTYVFTYVLTHNPFNLHFTVLDRVWVWGPYRFKTMHFDEQIISKTHLDMPLI